MKVVKILWEDSCNSNLSWVTKEDVEVELVNIDSFGVVVKETDEFVSIAQNYGSEPEQFSNIVTIPRGCIKEIFVIHDDNYVRQCEQKPVGVLKIEGGKYYYCVKDYLADDGEVLYTKGKIYCGGFGIIDNNNADRIVPDYEDYFRYATSKELFDYHTPVEWSEEDEKHRQNCLSVIKMKLDEKPYPYYNDYLWLKSLHPQKQWKPNEEQLKQLSKYCIDNRILTELYEQLKAL